MAREALAGGLFCKKRMVKNRREEMDLNDVIRCVGTLDTSLMRRCLSKVHEAANIPVGVAAFLEQIFGLHQSAVDLARVGQRGKEAHSVKAAKTQMNCRPAALPRPWWRQAGATPSVAT